MLLLAVAWPLSLHAAVLFAAPAWPARVNAAAIGLIALHRGARERARDGAARPARPWPRSLAPLLVAPQLLLFAPPVVINAAVAWFFGASLRAGPRADDQRVRAASERGERAAARPRAARARS